MHVHLCKSPLQHAGGVAAAPECASVCAGCGNPLAVVTPLCFIYLMRYPPEVDPLARLWLLDADVRGLVCCALCVGIVLVGTFGILSELLYLAALAPGVLLCRRARVAHGTVPFQRP